MTYFFSARILFLALLASCVSAAIVAPGKSLPGLTARGRENNAKRQDDAQSSLTLDQRVIAQFNNNGQDNITQGGQVPSLTSGNNYINFCLTYPNLPISNGSQIKSGSCIPTPMGAIPSVDHMPVSRFTSPRNLGTLPPNTTFTVNMTVRNLVTGQFTNPNENYYSAPQQLSDQGIILGHSHVVIEPLINIDQITPTDPTKFVFFKGFNVVADGYTLSVQVTGGLPVGIYRMSSIHTASNHQPVLTPVAQHGAFDDTIYIFVTQDGRPVHA